jgi:predicted unusual protein kinase regulating ubiquinone biosynthesis (AarF/ABC1/UbiB family)
MIYKLLFVFNAFWIILTECFLFCLFRNFESFIDRLTGKLAKINILYVKIFQAFALNNSLIDDKLNNKLLRFTDNAPWTYEDIDHYMLYKIEDEYNLILKDGFEPINSGMISLVFKAYRSKTDEVVIIKIKRIDIEKNLNEAIENLLFFVYLLSFFPYIQKYNISELINKNIGLIKSQTNFEKEVQNMEKMTNNCKHLRYVKIPKVYTEVTQKYPNIIVMEYMVGVTINKIKEEDYEPFARQVMKFGFVTTLIHGVCHGDLHCGNILFIKDENDANYPHKIIVLDFGIIYEIDESFRHEIFGITETFKVTSDELAHKLLYSGLIEPIEIIKQLPKNHHDNLIKIFSNIVSETLNNSKEANQLKIYKFLSIFNSYMIDNNLFDCGLSLSNNFVKTQMSIAMAHGVTFTLCKDDFVALSDNVINELFHTKLLQSD